MQQDFKRPQIIFDGAAVLQAAFTAATTDIITSNSHGFSGGEILRLTTSTTLPAGLSASTDYYVRDVTTNTFKLSATPDGTPVDITDTGTGTHTFHLQGKVIYTMGYRHLDLHIASSGTSTMTFKFQGSFSDAVPAFANAQSTSNEWDYVDVQDLEDGSSIDGDTGIALSGADDNRHLEVNVNQLRYFTVAITAWTQGKLRATLTLSNG